MPGDGDQTPTDAVAESPPDCPVTDESSETPAKFLKQSKKDKPKTDKLTVGEILRGTKPKQPKPEKPKQPIVQFVPQEKAPIVDSRSSRTMLEYFSLRSEKELGAKPLITMGKDTVLINKLINHYGYEHVVDMIDFTLEHFSTFQRDKRITGNPTIGIIYGFREYIIEKMKLFKPVLEEESGSAW